MGERQELLREIARVAELVGKCEASNPRPAIKISRARYSLDNAITSDKADIWSAVCELREVQP